MCPLVCVERLLCGDLGVQHVQVCLGCVAPAAHAIADARTQRVDVGNTVHDGHGCPQPPAQREETSALVLGQECGIRKHWKASACTELADRGETPIRTFDCTWQIAIDCADMPAALALDIRAHTDHAFRLGKLRSTGGLSAA